jgi:similar to stage IV sporulation protein
MFLVYLWNYIRGYVIIVVTGRSVERFINICSKREILLWDIVRNGNESAVMKASRAGFCLMRPAAKKSGCRVRIQKKCGLPFFIGRFKKRKGLKAGLVLFASLLLLSTSIIWDIQITGCKPEVIPQVMNVLNTEKIGRGSFKTGLDPKKIAARIITAVDGISWVGVEIKGVKLNVTIKDSIAVPDLINNNEFFNIIATRDGLIRQIEVFAGNAKVQEGETVKKGQLLVSGKLESKYPELGTRDVHALGRVIARTWYESSLPVSMEYTQRLRSGKSCETYYLRILDWKLRIPGAGKSYEISEKATYDKTLAGPFGLKFPIGLTVEKSFEIVEKKVALTYDEAVGIAEERAREELSHRLPPDSRVTDEKVNQVSADGDQTYIQVVLECEEDIAGLEPAANNAQGR